ncbi:MAG: M50 family metallopeptidase [Elusimicrobiaceae bacterium]|nr:M50 family metallopeptidase [Elusimicrobiaceae bacterium]
MIKFLAGVAALPAVALVLYETGAAFVRIFSVFRQGFPFLGGMAAYTVLHYLVYRPQKLYVLTHELTHAAAAWSSGFNVRRMRIGKDSGSVVLDGSNAFVALAPYCLPLFAAMFAICYAVAGLFYDLTPWTVYFMPGLGFLLAFHLVNTVEVLCAAGQSDLDAAGGTVFSTAVIVLSNCVVLLAAFKFLFPETVAVRAGAQHVAQGTVEFWSRALNAAAEFLGRIYAGAGGR